MRRLAAMVASAMLMTGGAAMAADQAALDALKAKITSGEVPGVHGVLIVQHGKPVAEWYFEGVDQSIFRAPAPVKTTPETLHDVRSVTKSVTGLMIGIALAEGRIQSLDTPVLDYFPEYADLQTPERRKITLRHMLSMTSGFAWDESLPYTDPRNSEIAMGMSADSYRYVLSQTIEAEPGTRFKYSGGDVEVMAQVLVRGTKTPIKDYAREKLFGPLGIAQFEWAEIRGNPMAASGLRLTPRDMVKIGALVLNGGRHEGKQVVPESWIKLSTTPHAVVDPTPECGTKYGYFWWLGAGCAVTPRTPWIAAIGNGGQRIWIVPSRDLVVVSTIGLYDKPQQGPSATAVFGAALAAVPAN